MWEHLKQYSFIFVLIFAAIHICYAQGGIRFTDEQWIELEIDLIRKGIQQQDSAKILKVCSEYVKVARAERLSKDEIGRRFESVFANSSRRKMNLDKPQFTRDDCPLITSHFWDFDVLNPKIEIRGDSAFVDCELVLWAGEPDPGQIGMGARATERLVFYSRSVPREAPDLSEKGLFPASPEPFNRSWQLVEFGILLEFLRDSITPDD